MDRSGSAPQQHALRRHRIADCISLTTDHQPLIIMSHYPNPYSTTGTTYPYTGYHPQTPGAYAHPQSSGAYPTAQYQPYAPPTAVTSYGTWPYGYSYYPQQQQAHTSITTAPRPATSSTSTTTTTAQTTTIPAPITAAPAVASTVPARSTVQSTYTFTPYNRDSTAYGRSARKGSNYRGLFTKERE